MPWDRLKFTLTSGAFVSKGIGFKAEAEAFDASSGAVLLTNIMQTEDCVGDALQGAVQGHEPVEIYFELRRLDESGHRVQD